MITHMYGKDISIDISAQREHDVNMWKQDRRWMYGVDLMPKCQRTSLPEGVWQTYSGSFINVGQYSQWEYM